MVPYEEARAIVGRYGPPYGAMQRAMRAAYGVKRHGRAKRRRRPHGAAEEPTRAEVLECMRQTHGVSLNV